MTSILENSGFNREKRLKIVGTSPVKPAASRMNTRLSAGIRSTRPPATGNFSTWGHTMYLPWRSASARASPSSTSGCSC